MTVYRNQQNAYIACLKVAPRIGAPERLLAGMCSRMGFYIVSYLV